MNTKPGSHPSEPPIDVPDGGFSLPPVSSDTGHQLAKVIANLQGELVEERDSRREERFNWLCLVALLGNFIAYPTLQSVPVFVILFLFQLILLAGAAHRLGVDWAVRALGLLFHTISRWMPGGRPIE